MKYQDLNLDIEEFRIREKRMLVQYLVQNLLIVIMKELIVIIEILIDIYRCIERKLMIHKEYLVFLFISIFVINKKIHFYGITPIFASNGHFKYANKYQSRMYPYFFGFFIFCVILFFYLHIYFHLKTSDDLEIYEIDSQNIEDFNKDKLEEICDLRQPMVFSLDSFYTNISKLLNRAYLQNQYRTFEMKVRDHIHEKEDKTEDKDDVLGVPLPYHETIDLLGKDEKGKYISEKNDEFLSETGLRKQIQSYDAILRPYMMSNCYYDILLGSEKAGTPFRYELSYRNYFMVTEGSVKVKMAPPKYGKFLNKVKDYENFEFRSEINVWKEEVENEKIKFLEMTMTPGQILFIPAYWWYSFQFNKDSMISVFQYKTYMNNIALIPHYLMYVLQMQNMKRKIV